MPDTTNERHLVENEVFFRGLNKRAISYVKELNEIASDDNKEYLRYDDDPLHFYCECADENCKQRILIKPSRVKKIHATNNRFVVLPGHEVNSIEKVVKRTKKYYEVQKNMTPPKSADTLYKTGVDNVTT